MRIWPFSFVGFCWEALIGGAFGKRPAKPLVKLGQGRNGVDELVTVVDIEEARFISGPESQEALHGHVPEIRHMLPVEYFHRIDVELRALQFLEGSKKPAPRVDVRHLSMRGRYKT